MGDSVCGFLPTGYAMPPKPMRKTEMDDAYKTVPELREQIDRLDSEIVELLNKRVEIAQRIGSLKGKTDAPYYTPEREAEIYRRLCAQNRGPLQDNQLAGIFREIISTARASEKTLTVAYWGPEGTFSHVAALETFGSSCDLLACDSIEDVFQQVERLRAEYGVVPVENSIAGIVPETLDMFPQTDVKICGELYVAVHHHLLSRCRSLDEVRVVYAGPQPAAQCKRWLRENLPGIPIESVAPTATAIARAKSTSGAAAIGNSLAAQIVAVPTLVEYIEDNPQNRTRFLVIGYNEPRPTDHDKTSLMFNLRNRPGELYRALGAFVEEGVNLRMIESRPSQRPGFEYIFYIDCDGHRSGGAITSAVESLREHALETTILGSYPSAEDRVR